MNEAKCPQKILLIDIAPKHPHRNLFPLKAFPQFINHFIGLENFLGGNLKNVSIVSSRNLIRRVEQFISIYHFHSVSIRGGRVETVKLSFINGKWIESVCFVQSLQGEIVNALRNRCCFKCYIEGCKCSCIHYKIAFYVHERWWNGFKESLNIRNVISALIWKARVTFRLFAQRCWLKQMVLIKKFTVFNIEENLRKNLFLLEWKFGKQFELCRRKTFKGNFLQQG